MALTAGTRLGPYEILAPIGAGGMGEVWKATDTRLGRVVAIKVLNGAYSDRFEQEARAIAALNHPHICTLYDVGPDYLVMEYIEGSPLKGPQPVDEAVRLAAQIASALEAAHAKGILHRDLKPGNILVSAAGAKLLDFGLAKLTADADATRTIGTSGTPVYMSPEQAEGKALDIRTDVFSFGAVLYELLSGRRAFDSLGAVLRDEPAPLESPVADIVKRCLSKQAAGRFHSMAEVKAALDQIAAKSAGGQQPSIAVLPFANMSRDADDEYFSDGLAEEIINALTQVSGLKVIARTSAFAFKGKNEDIRKIAEALGVSNVLEGSVRRAGNRLRVTAQLIHAADGTHLWSQRYDREMTDVFAVQDEIATAITASLEVRLVLPPAARQRYQPNLPAYEAYLKARHYWAKITPESLARSKEYYEQAIALDSNFALAYIGLADYFLLMAVGAGLIPAHESMQQVRTLAHKAIDIDSELPEAHAMLGIVAALYDYNWKEAELRFGRAISSEPGSPVVHSWCGNFFLQPTGQTEEAIKELERALQGDPLNPIFRVVLALVLMDASRYERASAECRRLLELDENLWYGYSLLAWSQVALGELADALSMAERGHSLAPWSAIAIGVIAAVLRLTGDARRAEELLGPLRNAPKTYAAPRGPIIFHTLCNETDRAAAWAEEFIAQRDPYAPVWSRWLLGSSARWPTLAEIGGADKSTRRRFRKRLSKILVCVLLLVVGGCKSAPHPEVQHYQIGWRPLGKWSGRGDTQTESFNIESTQWRIKWETKGAASPGAGSFHVVVHSAVSGRPIQDAEQHQGDGRGVAYVTEDPRLYHLVIESSGVDWSIAVEEAVVGDVR